MIFARAAAPLALLLAISGCASSPPASQPSPATSAAPETCEQVTLIVDFGVLDSPSLSECVDEGIAIDSLTDSGVDLEGTVEWGDQIVCRVNNRPAPEETITVEGEEPFVEECQGMPAATAYWALWVKPSADAEWEYAQEGVASLQLEAGQSLGLVYTAGTESVPPAG